MLKACINLKHPLAIFCLTLISVVGCEPQIGQPTGRSSLGVLPPGPLAAASLDSGQLLTQAGDLVLAGSRNETLGFAIRVDDRALDRAGSIRVVDLRRDAAPSDKIAADMLEWGQVLPVPVDLNRAGFVRQSGVAAGAIQSAPRAILPLPAVAGGLSLASLRPVVEGAGIALWFDLPIPLEAAPGDYSGAVEVLSAKGQPTARLPIRLRVNDLALPDRRNLHVFGQVRWDDLLRHFPDRFEAVTPKLMNRSDPRYRQSIDMLDMLVSLAQRHRLNIAVDRLQPTVQWRPFSADWRDFDALVGPWLGGSAFADKEGLGLWPLPAIDALDNIPVAVRREYYANAAAHFDAKEWLSRAPVWIDAEPGELATGRARRRLLESAATVLAAHPRVHVALPLEADQLQFAESGNSTLPARADDDRILAAGPGLIFNTPLSTAPRRAPTFLRTDLAGLIPYAGIGGDERDVRVWAWLAYVRGASIIRFDNVFPQSGSLQDRADPGELVWFYPGKWFGVDRPVPTLQLKWLRRAQQDFEYLTLADARGQRLNARLMARLLTRPVQIQPAQAADPVYGLMSGTADQQAWDEGMRLLTRTILLRPPGQQAVDTQAQTALNLETLAWAEPQEKPLVLGRTTVFSSDGKGGVELRLGIDVYNASDTTPTNNTLGFAQVPRGWTIEPAPQLIPPLATYQVQRFSMKATIDPDALTPRARPLVSLTFTNGYTGRSMPAPLVVPAAVTRRREGGLAINGSLEDWTEDDALCLTPLVRMLDRATLQQHTLTDAATPASVYSAWSEANFYVAFKLTGLSQAPMSSGQNFIRYDFRRAWGEDVVQVLVQAVYADGTLGPVLHVAVKPNGGLWSERKMDLTERAADDAWEPLDSGSRYFFTLSNGDWRGELAIPWRALQPANLGGVDRLPVMLRFNITQHQHATGASASWAGPIDHGRDDSFTGILVLRDLVERR